MHPSFRLIQLFSVLALLTVAGLMFSARPAPAAVPDAPWTGAGTAKTTVTSDGSKADPAFEYSVAGSNGSWTFSAVAKSARKQTIPWRYKGFHAWFNVRVAIEKYVVRGGTQIVTESLASAGPVNCCKAPSGGFDYRGVTTFDLQPGDVYGFRMSGSHFDSDRRLIGSLALGDPTPPAVTPVVTGKPGKGGYYTSDVAVSWKVDDPDSPVSARQGCDDAKLVVDTNGETYTCSATSMGGTTKQSVTIRRDAAAPELKVPGTILKEGAGPVDYAATATDALDKSPSVACSPPSGTQFALGATAVTCTATDAAGNTATKAFDVLVTRGVVAPQAAKKISPVLAFRASVRHRRTVLKQLIVKRLPAGSTATVTCKGKSCPSPLKRKAVTRRVNTAVCLAQCSGALTSVNITKLVKGRMKAGTVITVVVTAPDGATATKKLTTRGKKAPRVS